MATALSKTIFTLFHHAYRVKVRLWSAFYAPFLGMGPGSRLEKVQLLTNPHLVHLGRRTAIAHGARIEALDRHRTFAYEGRITIGDGTQIQPFVHLAAAAHLEIGQNVLMGSRVFITDHDHAFDDLVLFIGDQPLKVAAIRIEDSAWLGENVVVLKGVTIGSHSVIGANSVVTKSIPPYSIAVGTPARVVGTRTKGDLPLPAL